MKFNHLKFKNIANILFLIISCFLIVYFLIQLTDNPYIKIGIAVFAVGLDIFMQYVLALARVRAKQKGHRFKAGILFICYALYVLVYAIPSAVGFFSVEISAQESVVNRAESVDTINRDRITQIGAIIENLNLQLEKEADTGYGARSKAIMDRIDKLSAEQRELQNKLSSKPKTNAPQSRLAFRDLAKITGISERILMLIIFGISTAMLYVGLIITSWDITIEDNEAGSVEGNTNLPEPQRKTMTLAQLRRERGE
jgi:hypothetical protein